MAKKQMSVKNVKDIIINLLTNDAKTRDNDNLLIAYVWIDELMNEHCMTKQEVQSLSTINFFKLLAKSQVTPPESITRCRRLLQQTDISLRGELYEERHKHSKNIKQEIDEYHQDVQQV